MFFLFFQLCAFIAIPLVFPLNIRLDSTPIGFHNTTVSLGWQQNDPSDFILGAFLIHTKEAIMVAKTMQPVENFAANQTEYMTFNYTSLPGNRDCILLAWLPDSKSSFCPESGVFSDRSRSDNFIHAIFSGISSTLSVSGTAPHGLGTTPTPPRIVVDSTLSPKLTTPKSIIPSSPTSSVTGAAAGASPDPASHTGIIVGIVLGVLTLGCMAYMSIYVLILRRRLKEAAPLLRPQDSPASSFPTPSMIVRQECETETQEPMSEVPRDRLETVIARMQEEITAKIRSDILRLDTVVCLHHHTVVESFKASYPSYRPSVPFLFCQLGVVPTLHARQYAASLPNHVDIIALEARLYKLSQRYHSINTIPFPSTCIEELGCRVKDLSGMISSDVPSAQQLGYYINPKLKVNRRTTRNESFSGSNRDVRYSQKSKHPG
ncbi:hypothetical protein IW262DRAFT_1532186 [Armillaria fumosa]|nr:hypothetical protein IW262DRAFT_1532186 [Armillaria fumosa]